MSKKVLVGCISVVLVLIGAWVAGFDFDERGFSALYIFICCLGAFFLSITCPLLDD